MFLTMPVITSEIWVWEKISASCLETLHLRWSYDNGHAVLEFR